MKNVRKLKMNAEKKDEPVANLEGSHCWNHRVAGSSHVTKSKKSEKKGESM